MMKKEQKEYQNYMFLRGVWIIFLAQTAYTSPFFYKSVTASKSVFGIYSFQGDLPSKRGLFLEIDQPKIFDYTDPLNIQMISTTGLLAKTFITSDGNNMVFAVTDSNKLEDYSYNPTTKAFTNLQRSVILSNTKSEFGLHSQIEISGGSGASWYVYVSHKRLDYFSITLNSVFNPISKIDCHYHTILSFGLRNRLIAHCTTPSFSDKIKVFRTSHGTPKVEITPDNLDMVYSLHYAGPTTANYDPSAHQFVIVYYSKIELYSIATTSSGPPNYHYTRTKDDEIDISNTVMCYSQLLTTNFSYGIIKKAGVKSLYIFTLTGSSLGTPEIRTLDQTPIYGDKIIAFKDDNNLIYLYGAEVGMLKKPIFLLHQGAACPSGQTLNTTSGLCQMTCTSTQYWTGATLNTCLNCSSKVSNCNACEDISFVCTSCGSQYYLTPAKSCQKKCSTAPHMLGSSDDCFLCSDHSSCSSCTNFTSHCTNCNPNYSLNQNNDCELSGCPAVNECLSNGACKTADVATGVNDCIRCSDGTNTCLECSSEFRLTPGKTKCERICSDDKGLSITFNSCYLCSTIHSQCTKCADYSTPATKKCEECSSGYTFNPLSLPFICSLDCDEGEYLTDSNTCLWCISHCKDCDDSSGDCTECDTGFDLIETTSDTRITSLPFCQKTCTANEFWKIPNDCGDCSPHCTKCVNENDCIDCEAGFLLRQGDKKCQKECLATGEYWISDADNRCEACPTNRCLECSDSTGGCTKCQTNFKVNLENQAQGFCQRDCNQSPELPEYWTGEDLNSCSACSQFCTRCVDLTGDCEECTSFYELKSVVIKNTPLTSAMGCIKIQNKISIREKYFNKQSTKVSVIFTEGVIIKDLSKLKFTLLQTSKAVKVLNPKSVTLTQGGAKLEVIFQFSDNEKIENGKIQITTEYSKNIEAKGEKGSFFTSYPIIISGVNYFTTAAEKAIGKIGAVGTQVTSGATVAVVVISLPVALALIKLFQMIDFLIFINIDLPSNTQSFLNLFNQNILKIMPNFVSFNEDTISCIPHQKLSEEELSCASLNNIGGQLGQIFGLLTLKLIFYILSRVTQPSEFKIKPAQTKGGNREKKLNMIAKKLENIGKSTTASKGGCLHRVFSSINDIMGIPLFCNFFMAFQLDILLGAFVNIKYASFKNKENIINLVIALIAIMCYTAFVFMIIRRTTRMITARKDKAMTIHFGTKWNRWMFLQDGVKEESLGQYIFACQVIKDYLIAPFLILFVNDPVFQIIPLQLLFMGMMIFYIYYWPMKKKSENITLLINDFLYLVCLTLFLVYQMKKDSLTEEQRYTNFGFPIIGVLALIVLTNLTFGTVVVIRGIRNRCRERNLRKIQKQEEIQIQKRRNKALGRREDRSLTIDSTVMISGIKQNIQRATLKKQLKKERKRLNKKRKKRKKITSNNDDSVNLGLKNDLVIKNLKKFSAGKVVKQLDSTLKKRKLMIEKINRKKRRKNKKYIYKKEEERN